MPMKQREQRVHDFMRKAGFGGLGLLIHLLDLRPFQRRLLFGHALFDFVLRTGAFEIAVPTAAATRSKYINQRI